MKKFFLVIQALILALAACAKPTPIPATPLPSITPKPPVPSATSTLMPSPTLDVAADKIKTLVVVDGFSISIPFPLLHQAQNNVVLIASEDKALSISFVGDTYDGTQPLIDVMDSFLGSLEKRGATFFKGEAVEIQIDRVEGISSDLTGKLHNVDVQGQAVVVSPRPDFILFGIALSKVDSGASIWEKEHKTIFQSLLDGIKFTNVDTACPTSTDKTYGFSQENPIKVGGGDFNGPSRERAYLDHLLGPNGEILTYERNGSTMTGDVILDIYHLSGAGIDSILYVDEYNFLELQAPLGFTCQGAFPLSAP